MNTLVDQRYTAAFGVIELHAVVRPRTGSRLSADSGHTPLIPKRESYAAEPSQGRMPDLHREGGDGYRFVAPANGA